MIIPILLIIAGFVIVLPCIACALVRGGKWADEEEES
jgi:hypothetical protein